MNAVAQRLARQSGSVLILALWALAFLAALAVAVGAHVSAGLRLADALRVSMEMASAGQRRAICSMTGTTRRICSSSATCAAPVSRSALTFQSPRRGTRGSFGWFTASRATRSAKTSPSSSELLARRFAPCTPVRDTSPQA